MRFIAPTLRYTLICVCSTFFHLSVFAQDTPIKFGKIDIADLQMKVYPKDTAAEAVVLGDIGRAYFKYDDSNHHFYIIYERHCRIKILKKAGYDWSTVSVPLYKDANGRNVETMLDLKGITYNLVDGQIQKDKLEKESTFLDKGNEYRATKKFTFSNIKEGSVIEYSYSIKSDFFYNFRDWLFQSSIPVAWSEFSTNVPNYFTYRQVMQGYEPLVVNSSQNGEMTFQIKVESPQGSRAFDGSFTGGKAPSSIEKVTTPSKESRWVMKNLPAIRKEPFMTTIDDYVAKMSFELSSTYIPGTLLKTYSDSWESLNSRLIENEFFGQQLNRSGFLNDMVSLIKNTQKDTLQQIDMAYQLVKQAMTYDGKETFYVGTSIKKALENKIGNVADINLMLVVLLRELGYNANPVILSTRDNGRILDNYILLSKFNYVIAQLEIDGKDLLLDATSSHTPLGVLPIRCLNGQGRLISKNGTRWVNLYSSQKLAETCIANFDIKTDNTAKGDLVIAYMGYRGINERKKITKEGNDKYIEEFKKENQNWKVDKSEIEKVEDIYTPLTVKHNLTINDFATITGDRIYFNPLVYKAQKENPFKSSERKFPVDFGTLIEDNFIATYAIPAGYDIEEIPKSIKVSFPDDGGRFTYTIGTQDEGKITVSSKISLKKTAYLAEEYEALRKLYDQIVQKHAEQIVLKKK